MLGIAALGQLALAQFPGAKAPSPVPTPSNPRAPTGKIFIIDAVQNFTFGQPPNVNESCALLIYVGPGLPLNKSIVFLFVRPDGSDMNGDPVWAFIGKNRIAKHTSYSFPAHQYVIYTFGVGDLNQKGTWRCGFTTGGYVSNTFTFRVN